MNFVAVTSCPTGIAHSQMAAKNLEQTAAEQGHEISVEVQGAMGAENELSAADIDAADAVVIASDTSVSQDRFENVPVVKGTVKDAVNDAAGLLERAVAAADGDADAETGATTDSAETETAGSQPRRGGDRSKSLVARLNTTASKLGCYDATRSQSSHSITQWWRCAKTGNSDSAFSVGVYFTRGGTSSEASRSNNPFVEDHVAVFEEVSRLDGLGPT